LLNSVRQWGKSLDEIRPDHVKRYQLAAQKIKPKGFVLDIACGCGYGSKLLHGLGFNVTGVDISEEAINYAREHHNGPNFIQGMAEDDYGPFDAVVSFETLEHLKDPLLALKNFEAPFLWASVPNEEKYPFSVERFKNDEYPHQRHYTPKQFDDLLREGGYEVFERYTQKDKQGDITRGTDGMFLIYGCRQV
jgi:SAM-dependent methyltransferase